MKLRSKQHGFTAIELVIFVALVAAIGLIGYGVYSRSQTKKSNNNNPVITSQTTPATVSAAPAINSASDLNQALQTLDQNDPSTANTSDSNQLDSQLNGF